MTDRMFTPGFKIARTEQRFVATFGQRRVIRLLVGWLLVSIPVLASAAVLTVDRWIVLSVLGGLIIVQWTAPFGVVPPWRRRLRIVLVLAGFAFVGAIGYELSRQIETLV